MGIAGLHNGPAHVCLELSFEPSVDEHGARLATLGHLGQQINLVFDLAFVNGDIAPAHTGHFPDF